MKAPTISIRNQQLGIESPYDATFVAEFKELVPPAARQWDGAKKMWLVAPEQGDVVAELLRKHFGACTDERQGGDVELAQLGAEIRQIEESQQFVRAHTAQIEGIVEALAEEIKGYSPRSASNVRAALAQDMALFQHSLRNATQPAALLVEVQVRGLAAACRILKADKAPRNWPRAAFEIWRAL